MITKEDIKKQIDVMIEKENTIFLKDTMRGWYLRTWCPRCDDFKTCEKTAGKLDDCRMQMEVSHENFEREKRDFLNDLEKTQDETEAGSSVEKQNKKR